MEEIRQVPLNIPLRIYNSDNKLIAEYGDERRIPVSLDAAPPLLIDAILVTEDDRFYYHTGVDFPGLIRALISNLRSQSRSQGASTITMQVARNFFLTPEKTYTRKLKEMLLAFNMERALTKDEILELYLNKIFLGHRAYGFAAASQVYYGVELKNLSVPEIAMLAGLPKAPSRDNTISNAKRATERRDYVHRRLYDLGKIDGLSYNTARQAPITAARYVADVEVQAPYVAEMARQFMVEKYGEEVYGLGFNVTVTINSKYQIQADEALRNGLLDYDKRHGFRGPLANINLDEYTPESLDKVLLQYPKSRELVPAVVLETGEQTITALTQDQETINIDWDHIKWARAYKTPNSMGPEPATAAEVVSTGDIIYVSRVGDSGWRLNQMPAVSGALVSLDPNTGAILALTGGFDYYLSKFNRATQALRQPGSNIKPFIYSAALANGFTPSSLVSAGPIVIEDDLEGIWRPQNYSKKFFGPTRLRKALSLSLNLVSVRLLRAIGIDKTIDHLTQFGFNPDKLPRSLSLALGSTTVTPLELAAGFAVFANGGKRVKPYLIERIVDGDGNEVELSVSTCDNCTEEETTENGIVAEAEDETMEPVAEPDRAISEQNAFLISSMMRQVILTGTGRRALALNRTDLSGKTGTTNNYRDAWFSGFNPDVITTVFVGFDQPSYLGRRESGASAALPIWIDYMKTVLADFPEQPIIPPANITTRFVNKDTGKLTSAEDPEGYLEYFLAGTEPANQIEPPATSQALTSDGNLKSETLF
ncbi:MAG: penicillin-binding protein 1A [Gammaproteobacteria bacterium]